MQDRMKQVAMATGWLARLALWLAGAGLVLMTALIGLVGYRFIDNAAHFGGLLAGMAYAGIVFPKSGSVLRPRVNVTDRIIGTGSVAVLVFSAIFAISKIWG